MAYLLPLLIGIAVTIGQLTPGGARADMVWSVALGASILLMPLFAAIARRRAQTAAVRKLATVTLWSMVTLLALYAALAIIVTLSGFQMT